MSIIPKTFGTAEEYENAVDKYYGKENFNNPQEANEFALLYTLKNLIP